MENKENMPVNVLSDEAWLIYLRKSRADNPDESVEEVLAKHEAMLQELAERELGGRIPEHCIFREVVSGETIAERPEMQKVLAAIENPNTKGILVVEEQRLSRGDLEDCGKVVNAFRYSNTKVKTLKMTYDLTNKMERKFFEQELMRGNDFLEYTKEILYRGRIAAVKRGAFIGNCAPFGYDKAMIDEIHSLKPNEDADAVRLVFDMFVNQDKTFLQIARHLDSIGVKPMRGELWEKCSVKNMLKNIHYAGYVRFGGKKTEKFFENGQIIKKRGVPSNPDEIIIAKGKQQPLVTKEMYDAAQAKINNHPRVHPDKTLKNPLAGICFCSKCGRTMSQHPYKHAKTRIECRFATCKGSKSAILDEVVDAVIFALENEKLPELEVKLRNNDGDSLKIQQTNLQKMNAELVELQLQEETQFEMLEKRVYSEDVFMKRNKALHVEMEALKTRIFEAKKFIPQESDYEERIVSLKKAIEGLRDDNISITAKNKLLKAIVKRIDYEYLGYEGKGKVKYKLHIMLAL